MTKNKIWDKELQESEDLEKMVAERTNDLIKKVNELESLNKFMVGREVKMMELKKEIEKLKEQIKNKN